MSEITAVVEATKEYSLQKQNWIILQLHSTLSISEQDKVSLKENIFQKYLLNILYTIISIMYLV